MNANDENKGRKRKSRENTQEERRKQRKEWGKKSNRLSGQSQVLPRMLKAIATIMGFHEKVSVVVKTATNNEPFHRANIQQFAKEIAAVQI